MADDIEYTYALNQYEVVKQTFLKLCKNEVGLFISRNEELYRNKLSFLILPNKPYEEQVTFHNVCKCDDIDNLYDIHLDCLEYNSDWATPVGNHRRRDTTYPTYERHGY